GPAHAGRRLEHVCFGRSARQIVVRQSRAGAAGQRKRELRLQPLQRQAGLLLRRPVGCDGVVGGGGAVGGVVVGGGGAVAVFAAGVVFEAAEERRKRIEIRIVR